MKSDAKNLDRVLLPISLHQSVGEFFMELQKQVVDSAFVSAGKKCARGERWLITEDDLLVAARDVLPTAMGELEKHLRTRAAPHVRRTAS